MSTNSQNVKENFMNSMSGRIAAGALVFTTAFLPMTGKLANTFDGIANAQDNKAPVTKVASGWDKATPASLPSKREAWMDASDYSAAHHNVSFAVYGHAPNASNEQIVEYVRTQLANRGIHDVTAFKGRENMPGVAFYFYIDDMQYGPVGIPQMKETIEEVAEHAKQFEASRTSQLHLAR